jgi:hypothetical protein
MAIDTPILATDADLAIRNRCFCRQREAPIGIDPLDCACKAVT